MSATYTERGVASVSANHSETGVVFEGVGPCKARFILSNIKRLENTHKND